MCTYNSTFFTKWVAIFLTVNFLIFSFLYSQEKKVVWVHGLNGHTEGENKSIWAKKYATEFQNQRKMNSLTTDYNKTSNSGVANYAKYIIDNTRSHYRGIAIGHSMGAMALREIDVYHQKPFSGIITVGAPLKGGNIINTDAGINFAQNTAYYGKRWIVASAAVGLAAVAGSLLPKVFGAAFIGNYYSAAFIASVVGINSELMLKEDGIIRWKAENMAPNSGLTQSDLQPNSGYTNQFNNTYTNTPKIQIFGNEYQPVAWHVLETNNLIALSTVRLINYASLTAALAWGVYAYWNPWAAYASYECFQTHHYFKDNGNGNAQWHTDVIQSSHWEKRSWHFWRLSKVWNCLTENKVEQRWNCRKWGWFSWLCNAISYAVSIVTCFWNVIWELVTQEYWELVLDPSDGVVPLSSQKGEGQEWSRNAIQIEALGVNHNEMGNHDEMTKIFNAIWDGARVNGVEDRGDLFYAARR